MRKCCGCNQYQQFIDRISRLEARIATLQEVQQEQIRMAEVVIQQLRANPTNPPPPLRAAFQKPVTESGAFKALIKNTGNHFESHDWSFSARRVLTRADGRFAGPLQWISGQIDDMRKTCLSIEERLNSAPQTWLGSTRNCTHSWPSRPLPRRWHPSSHWKKWSSKELLVGDAWNVMREGINDASGKSDESH